MKKESISLPFSGSNGTFTCGLRQWVKTIKKTSEKTESQDTNTSLEATNQLIEAEDPSALPETAAKRKEHTDRRCCRLCRCIQPGILGSK